MIGRLSLAMAALSLSACSVPDGNQTANIAQAGAGQEQATLAISTGGANGCGATWNGETVTPAAVTERSLAVLERALAAAGGPSRIQMEQFPTLRVEAAPAVPWSCARNWVEAAGRAGFARVQFATDAQDEAAPAATFPLPGMPPAQATVAVRGEGSFAWEGAAVDADGLRARLAAASAEPEGPPPPPGAGPPPGVVVGVPGELLVAPEDSATIGAVRQALLILRASGQEPNIAIVLPNAPPPEDATVPPPPVVLPPPGEPVR